MLSQRLISGPQLQNELFLFVPECTNTVKIPRGQLIHLTSSILYIVIFYINLYIDFVIKH